MQPLLSCAEVREREQRAVRELGMPTLLLMENAGRGCAELLLSLGVTGRVVLCWEPDRDRLLPTESQLGDEPMPLPWVAPSTGNQGVGCQRSLLRALDGRHERGDGRWRTGQYHCAVQPRFGIDSAASHASSLPLERGRPKNST